MSDPKVSEPVRRFLLDHIDSIEQLEVLLTVSLGSRAWTIAAVQGELRTDMDSARNRLQSLEAQGFLRRSADASFTYDPRTEDLRADVEVVRSAYQEHRYAVINLILAKPNDLIQTFADAFRFKKGKKDG